MKELAREVEQEEQSPVTVRARRGEGEPRPDASHACPVCSYRGHQGFESAFNAYGSANRKIGRLVRKGAAKRRRRQQRPQRRQRATAPGAT